MHTTGRLMSTVAASPTTANSLEAVLRRHLQHSKGGNVYAASAEHQRLLSGMYCYVKGIAAARKDLGLSDTDMLTDEEVERASCTDQKAIIERPICGHIPFKALKETTDAAGNYVNDRYQLRGEKCEEIPLLCTIGCEGSGKTVTLLHTTAAAVHVMEGMVRKRTKNATERKRWRPLGFYVSFAGGNVSIELHKQKFLPMTAIALRVAYSVIDDCCATRPKGGMEAAATTAGKKISYEEFATEVLAECKFRWDEETFRGIVAALRAVLAWDGPMFIAIDDFEQAYQHKLKKIGEGLRHVSTELLMSDKALPISCNANKQHVELYETYLAVSACCVADLVAAAPTLLLLHLE
ncbi:multi-copy leucine-rich repeat protein, putative [Bodo saltans]|uniref:Multi-copy leucine-rich repeat protein, putative n=1 Tax=Bodo saltans TaxID=75058 RepID=A0A0S4KHM3_BODSA|nr:multi-copy leucine-rich repeat protein, putative [Bodo saltans]|eukprot:CUI15137.1 multi-copy leucine-rich repeat protein, putative [Bodo saltans]